MARIFTHAPSKEYDAGWDAIFGKRAALKELTRLTEEAGGYDKEMQDSAPSEPDDASKANLTEPERKETKLTEEVVLDPASEVKQLPGGGVRMPRGWTPAPK